LVAEEHRKELIQRIEERYQRGIPWTRKEILEFVQKRSLEPVDKNSLYHWLQRGNQIKSCR
jgi:transposase